LAAAVFLLVNATYIGLIWELIDRTRADEVPPAVRRIMRIRSITALCLFGLAAVVALEYPLAGLGICIFLPDRLSEASSAGSWGADISGIERTFERVIQRHVPDPLAEQILAGAYTVRVSVRYGELTINGWR
jgi:hypothetical protein